MCRKVVFCIASRSHGLDQSVQGATTSPTSYHQDDRSKKSNTAPGPDRVSYFMWKRTNLESHALSAVMNVCLHRRRISTTWKGAKTILIPKKVADPDAISSWRPIALSCSIYAGCLAVRRTRGSSNMTCCTPPRRHSRRGV